MNKQICPKCEGAKQTFRRINRGLEGCDSRYYPCQFCDAAGEVEPEKPELLELGKKLRFARTNRNIMVRVCAYNFGLAFSSAWADLENGRATKEEVLNALAWIESANLQSGYVSESELV